MRRAFHAFILALAAPLLAFGHAEIFFPKVFSPVDLPTTGFALLNPDPEVANVNLYFIDLDGKLISQSPARSIPAGGQLAVLGTELFPDASRSGWVYLITDTEGMQAFWLSYDQGMTSLDGAPASQYSDLGADQILPLVAPLTELNIINPNFIRVPLIIRMFGTAGELGSAVRAELPIAGALRFDVSSLFPAVDMTQVRYLRIQTAGASITSSAIIRGFMTPSDFGVINGLTVAPRTDLKLPHVIDGPLGDARYTTVIGVTNLADSQQTITLTFNPDGGLPISVTRTLSVNSALRETAQSLFALSANYHSGWVTVTANSNITGFAAYADQTAGAFAIVAPTSAQKSMFFSHIADGPPQWQTGLALLNSTDATANVEIYALSSSGAWIGATQFALPPGAKIARVIHEWIPAARGVNGGFLYVKTANDVPLHGMELFYTEDLKVLANVAAAALVPLVKYAPPPD